MLVNRPTHLPGDYFPCLYLFGGHESIKVGRTMNLTDRAKEYKPEKCICYDCGICDIERAETALVKHFVSLYPIAKGREWFVTKPEIARETFVNFCTEKRAGFESDRFLTLVSESPTREFDAFAESLTYEQRDLICFVEWWQIAGLWDYLKPIRAQESEVFKGRQLGRTY